MTEDNLYTVYDTEFNLVSLNNKNSLLFNWLFKLIVEKI